MCGGYEIQGQGPGAREPRLFVLLGGLTGMCPRLQNFNPVKIAAAALMAGAYNLKKVLPRHVLQRRQPPQINLSARTLE